MRAPCTAERPTAPQPITPTRAPSHTLAVSSTEPTPVATAQPIRHACSAGRLSPTRTAADSCTTVRVANVPSCSVWNSLSPFRRKRRAARGGVLQRRSSPRAHQRHSPQGERVSEAGVRDVQVGVADAGRLDPDDDLARAWVVDLQLGELEPSELPYDDAAIQDSSRSSALRPPISASVRSVSAASCVRTAATPSSPPTASPYT